jgi:hypothetical protein
MLRVDFCCGSIAMRLGHELLACYDTSVLVQKFA